MNRSLATRLLVCAILVPFGTEAFAQHRILGATGQPASEVPGLAALDVEEHLDEPLPLDLEFTDHEGKQVHLRDYFDGVRPVMLTFAYHSCPSMCSLVLDAASQTAKQLADEMNLRMGVDYQMLTISIDPRDTPASASAKRTEMLGKYGHADGDWDFLVGTEEAIEAATDAAGFGFFYNPRQEQYAHAAASMFLTPNGKFARYLYGLRFPPNDARFALLEAMEGRSIGTVNRLLLFCYVYDPNQSEYVLVAWNVMKIGGGLTALLLFAFLFTLWRRERRRGGIRAIPPTGDSDRTSDRPEPLAGRAPQVQSS